MSNKEVWLSLIEFPDYVVSNHGRVMNTISDRIKAPHVNQQGIVSVSLIKDRLQFRRSIAILVAQAFLPFPPNDRFDTPIHLDGDKTNCHVDNLMWRPRWFAVKYHKQFETELWQSVNVEIEEVHSLERFATPQHAAVKFGLLLQEIGMDMTNQRGIFPYGYRFRNVDN